MYLMSSFGAVYPLVASAAEARSGKSVILPTPEMVSVEGLKGTVRPGKL